MSRQVSSEVGVIEKSLETLASRAPAWLDVDLDARRNYLRRAVAGFAGCAEEWVAAAARRRDFAVDGSLAGEEWITGPMTSIRGLRLLERTLARAGRPAASAHRARERRTGRTVRRVFPASLYDRALYLGIEGEIWIEPDRPASTGRIYRKSESSRAKGGRVCALLGAGNIASIPVLDLVYKLFAENQVVLLKMNPINDYVGKFIEKAFERLIGDGFLQVIYGGAKEGEFICEHDLVDTIHITGSRRTHDAIVWGQAEEAATRRAKRTPRIDKEITSELGCVTPILVVPGVWSESSIDYQARHVASMVTHNASFNCNAGKVLVLAEGWAQRDAFLGKLRDALAAAPARRAYYPGAHERYRAYVEHYPQAEALGRRGEGAIPWTLIPSVPPRAGEYALQNEAFCGVLAHVDLPVDDAPTFLDHASRFVNEQVEGTLSACVLIDGPTQRRQAEAFNRALSNLRYGAVGINAWPGLIFALGTTTWGAYPGHTLEDIGSGIGVVHNALLFDHPQKSIVCAPFRIFPKPLWFFDHKNLLATAKALTAFEARPTPLGALRVALAALRG